MTIAPTTTMLWMDRVKYGRLHSDPPLSCFTFVLAAAGGNTTTFDACFHPEALVRAKQIDAFRHLVATSSLDAVEQTFQKTAGQKVSVERSEYRLYAFILQPSADVRLSTRR